jgi:hypothetical protein
VPADTKDAQSSQPEQAQQADPLAPGSETHQADGPAS